jgi:predicted transcriptional regulator of viral defense system
MEHPHGRAEKTLSRLLRGNRVARSRDLERNGIYRAELSRLVARGIVERVGRGLYALAGHEPTEHHGLVQAQQHIPNGVVCLLSALSFHGITTQAPFEIWMAIDIHARRPRLEYPPVRIVKSSGSALSFGVEEHAIEGVQVRITTPAKTVADCFKYRSQIGQDVAIEALREYIGKRLGTVDTLWEAATVCRVTKIIRPYIEAQL